MPEILQGAWDILNIPITIDGFTFAIWHPMGFMFLTLLIFNMIFGGGAGKKND